MRLKFLAAFSVLLLAGGVVAQTNSPERVFPQSKTAIENALKKLPVSGRLPTLDGFAVEGDHPLSRYQRGYYQCEVKVTANASGGSTVRINAKITAWYPDAVAAKAGYQSLPSNGRLESDLLDELQDALSPASAQSAKTAPFVADSASQRTNSAKSSVPAPSISAPLPNASELSDAISASRTSATGRAPKIDAGTAGDRTSAKTQETVADKHLEELRTEAQNLEEILRTQAHPSNLVAVKKSGTPVLSSPAEGAKLLFSASAGDEFEILDMNANWVHVRISGLSRGWLRRASVELPDSDSEATKPATETATKQPEAKTAGAPFEIANEQIASFPGDWAPLRGKTVKIISVQEPNGTGPGTDAQAKLEFAKKLLGQEFAELAHDSDTAGLVLIFDAEDGGMMATTTPVIQQWKSGDLSDEGLWRRSFFDPPEMSGKLASP